MGEWSDFFEDFPEENPANYDKKNRFDPTGALRQEDARIEIGQKKLDDVLKNKGLLKESPAKK